MDDYDDVDFWGGESPSARQARPPSKHRNHGADGRDMAVDEESEDGENSGDEIMVEGNEEEVEEEGDDDDDDDDNEEPGGPMEMELIGHR